MSTDRETTCIVRSWLEEGATALPDRVLDAVLDQVPATRQRRARWPAWISRVMKYPDSASSHLDVIDRTKQRHALRAPRRDSSMNGLVKWAAAAVVVVVVGGLAFVVLQPKAAPNVAAPIATTAAPATAPAITAAPATATPTTAAFATGDATAVAAGHGFTCAITASNAVKCWGYNNYGQLGNGTTTDSLTPVDVRGLPVGVTDLTVGGYHACVLTSAGGVQCWGRNDGGQLGNGKIVNSSTPVDVSGLTSGVTAIAAAGGWSCALTSEGAVKCWGWNAASQLGNGQTDNVNTPVDVAGLGSDVAAIAGGGRHTCALSKAGGVKCWGIVGSSINSRTPVDIAGVSSGVAAITAGDYFSCALLRAGGVKCWGSNGSGQLGNGTTNASAVAVDVTGLSAGIIAIAVGRSGSPFLAYHACALTSVGAVECWGENYHGQLGNGTTTKSSTPVNVSGLAGGVVAITVGGDHSCALMSSGGVACWGNNDNGRLGNGTTTDSSTPVVVKGL